MEVKFYTKDTDVVLSKKAKVYLDREITYIYPSYQDFGAGVVIEIK